LDWDGKTYSEEYVYKSMMLCCPLPLFLCLLFVLLCNCLAKKYTNDCESYNENEGRETNCPFARREEAMYLARGAEEWLEAY